MPWKSGLSDDGKALICRSGGLLEELRVILWVLHINGNGLVDPGHDSENRFDD
jgi:hypothetical protein